MKSEQKRILATQLRDKFTESAKIAILSWDLVCKDFTSFLELCNKYTKEEIKKGNYVYSTRITYQGVEYEINHRIVVGYFDYVLYLLVRNIENTWDWKLNLDIDWREKDEQIIIEFESPSNTGEYKRNLTAIPYIKSSDENILYIKALKWFYEEYFEKYRQTPNGI
jgi:hypothetical protein